jgi:ubiquitin-protein ligase
MDHLISLVKELHYPKLKIEICENVVHFQKEKQVFNLKINIDGEVITLLPSSNNLEEMHFYHLIEKQNFNCINQFLDLIEYVNNLNINNFCVICKDGLEFQSDHLVPCFKSACLYKYEEIITGDNVVQKVKHDPQIATFLIESAIDAIKCPAKLDIFEPFPTHFMKNNISLIRGTLTKLTNQNYDHLKDFARIDEIIKNLNIAELIEYSQKCVNDIEIAEKFGNDVYILIRFVLLSCKVEIQKNDNILGLKSNSFEIYKIIHPSDKEDEFNQIKCTTKSYLFHGSRWCNWYSILRNGLKNCSKTKLMTTGAAYGNGIYLASDVNTSFSYGRSGNQIAIGVFEICDKDKYIKTQGIYVVTDEKVLIQRYLLIVPTKNTNCINEINLIFNKKIHTEKLNVLAKYNKKSIAKIIREYKQLSSQTGIFRVFMDPDFPFVWNIYIDNIDATHEIAKDMQKYGVASIEMEIRFPENYPFSPPFIRVVTPRFMYQTGHITSAGSICQEILTEKGWVPTCCIESLITIVVSEIIEGGGRLDPAKYNIPYNYNEAKESFIRVAKSHGWL